MKNKKRYRILYVQKSQNGGSTLSLYELLRGLDRRIFNPVVLFHRPNSYDEMFKALGVKTIVMYNITPRNVSLKNSKRDIAKSLKSYSAYLSLIYRNMRQIYLFLKNDLAAIHVISKILKTEHIDIVRHNNSLPKNRSAVIAARMNKIPQVCHVRMFHDLSIVEKVIAKWIHSFIYISNAIKKCYLKQNIPLAKGRVIFNPVNGEITIDKDQVDMLRTEFGLTTHDRLIINVGRLDWWKGHDYFIKAMSKVFRHETRIKALIVGPIVSTPICLDYYNRLLQLIKDEQLTNKIVFTGFRSDIPQLLAASDIVVHSSSEPEPFGRVIVEGMLAGRPVVATAGGGVFDIIEDQVTGLLVPMKDANAMAEAISYLLNSPKNAYKIGSQAQLSAQRRFNVSKHVKDVQNVYQQIIECSQRQRG